MEPDFEKPEPARSAVFDLTVKKPNKTLDIGVNGVSISADPLGRILQLSAYHPKHGIIVAAPYEQFDGSKYYEPLYVRAYRKRMLEYIQSGRPGFGLRVKEHGSVVSIDHVASNIARVHFAVAEGIEATNNLEVSHAGDIIQQIRITNITSETKQVQYLLDLGLSVHRASYGQLTEGGPIPLPKSENKLELGDSGQLFAVVNPLLEGHLEGYLDQDGKIIELREIKQQSQAGGPVTATQTGLVEVPATSTTTISAHFHLIPNTKFSGTLRPSIDGNAKCLEVRPTWVDPDGIESFIIRRNLDYIVGNCAIPVSEDEVALITDHVALPLGWNRDNYWQVRLLLRAMKHMDKIATSPPDSTKPEAIRKIVKGHLRWVFLRAQRPHGFWHRSYLVTGPPKDGPVFQLDQQCYPFLELCDYLEQYPEEQQFAKSVLENGTTAEVLHLVLSKRDSSNGLLPTDETPGDDAVEYPYHFSSHLLLWYTLSRFAMLVDKIGASSYVDSVSLKSFADELRLATLKHFLTTRDERPMIAYLTNGEDHYTFYHDANDVPTLFASAWGFFDSAAQKEAWNNTLNWATTPENEKGYCNLGEYRGLGSVHSPGAWTLGYFQEYVYAQMVGNATKEADAWRRVQGAMQWDGTFSEAVDARTAECTSKAWFSWPGSMIASALIDMRAGEIGRA